MIFSLFEFGYEIISELFPEKTHMTCFYCNGSGIYGKEPVAELNECEECRGTGIFWFRNGERIGLKKEGCRG